MTYELQVERAARRALDVLPPREYERIEQAIDALAHNPRPRNARKIKGGVMLWRLRVGNYRIIYGVFDRERLVKIVRVARRREDTYRL
ncbi:MAG: type II toxin-antitoxin system RelE/ParE family toxin [Dehalococcoidia bacterium]|nr:type II toxin-antitoxin system RelE/ParE family toxin [Dehalococcoidia bacterium]